MYKIIKYILYDLVRTRFVLLYLLFLLLSTISLYQLDSDSSKVILSLMNILLMVVPLVSVVFTTIHFYNSYEFIEMILAQPVNRRIVFVGQYISISISLIGAFLLGVGLPMLFYGIDMVSATLLFSGILLTMVFVALAMLSSVLTRDKAKAIGIALLFWFYFSLIYDALLVGFIYSFSDYPLEKATLILSSLNPVDLARILMLLQLDISALMGYTGAFFKAFFGSNIGFIYSLVILLVWSLLPFIISLRIFEKKDL